MAIDLDGGTGLFDRLGRLGYLLNLINSRFGGSSADDFPPEFNDILEEYDAETDNNIRLAVDGLISQFQAFQLSPTTFRSDLRTVAETTLIEMADADNKLSSRTVSVALDELIRQMELASETVNASAVTISSLVDGPRFGTITGATQANPVVITAAAHGLADADLVTITGVGGMTEINNRQFTVNQTAAGTFELVGEDGTGHTAYTSGGQWIANYGNADLVLTATSGRGKALQNMFAEDLVLKIDTTTTAGSESGNMLGEEADSDSLSHQWPLGSGSSKKITVKNPSADGAWLTNGDMEDFTTNTPDSWTIDTGVAGADIKEEATTVYRGSKALEYTGDGATLSAISQDLSALSLKSRTPYPVSVQVSVDVVPAAGTLVLDLYDGAAIINDDQGTANSLTVDLTAANTTFQRSGRSFRLPEPVPATVKFRVRLSAAISAGSSAFIDDVIFGAAMTEMYTGGPLISLIRGSVDLAKDDGFIVTVTNTREGAFQNLFQKLFQTPEKTLPSHASGGETISDSAIG